MITDELIQEIRQQYQLPWTGEHGITHWARVLENGLRLAPITSANAKVVQYFAVFHDSRRLNEGHDPQHGKRGAHYAVALWNQYVDLSDDDFMLLQIACRHHTEGQNHPNVTVQTCWDADRLDLGRVGIVPDPQRLCTDAARSESIFDWAYQRSIINAVPDFAKNWLR